MLERVDAWPRLDPGCLTPEVLSLRDHLTRSREMLNALADPGRQGLVQILARGELSAGEIAARISLSRPTVSHHLGVLKRAGLVRARRQGKEIYYQLDKERIVAHLEGLIRSITCC